MNIAQKVIKEASENKDIVVFLKVKGEYKIAYVCNTFIELEKKLKKDKV